MSGKRSIRSRFRQGIAICLVLAVAVYGFFAIKEGSDEIGRQLLGFAWEWLPVLLALSLANYGVRFIRWELYLRMLDIRIPLRTSAAIFLAGLAMTITPGKLGEFLKSYLLKESAGVPMARSAPIVFVERVTDLLSLLLLASFGVATYRPEAVSLVVIALAVSAASIAILQSEPLTNRVLGQVERIPIGSKLAPKIREAVDASRALLGFRPLVLGVGLAALAWFFECAEYSLVFKGFDQDFPMGAAVFGYSFSTVAGVVAPGGVGPTDIFLIELAQLQDSIDGGVATAASFIVRVATLWLAVLLGALALLRFGKMLDVDVDAAREDESDDSDPAPPDERIQRL
ncbi:MAG: lysylphosphatidylglycerol synthase transmembrane domain-containing protein [Myxococcota bacterium]|nr:lysylphosphatidylglycerol synthase transmembrane domain-containing protein [Myxococcota bacterium]